MQLLTGGGEMSGFTFLGKSRPKAIDVFDVFDGRVQILEAESVKQLEAEAPDAGVQQQRRDFSATGLAEVELNNPRRSKRKPVAAEFDWTGDDDRGRLLPVPNVAACGNEGATVCERSTALLQRDQNEFVLNNDTHLDPAWSSRFSFGSLAIGVLLFIATCLFAFRAIYPVHAHNSSIKQLNRSFIERMGRDQDVPSEAHLSRLESVSLTGFNGSLGNQPSSLDWIRKTIPIENIQVGMRVPAHNPQLSDAERAEMELGIDPATWRTFTLFIDRWMVSRGIPDAQ